MSDAVDRPDVTPRAFAIGMLATLMLAAVLRWPGSSRPFGGDVAGYTGALYTAIARNMLDLGTLAPVVNPAATAADAVSYVHHPPLAPWATAAALALLGRSEGAARAPFLLASMLSVLLAAGLCRRHMGTRVAGLIAALLLATCPVAALYGQQIEVVGSLLLLGILGSVAAYADCLGPPRRRGGLRLAAWVAFTILADWPGLIAVFVLWIHAALVARSARLAIAIGAAAAAALAVVVPWLVSLAPSDGWALLRTKLYQRSFLWVDDQGHAFGLAQLVWRYAAFHWRMIGPWLVGLLVVWIAWRPRRVRTGPAPAILLAFAALFLAVSSQSMHQHDFWLHPVAATYAVVGAAALAKTGLRPALALAAAAVVAAGSAVTLHQTRALRAERPDGPRAAADHHELDTWVAQAVPRGDVVAVLDDTRWPTLPYYLDRKLIAIASLDELAALRREPRQLAAPWIEVPAARPPSWLVVRDPLPADTAHLLVAQRGPYRLYRLAAEDR